MDEYGLSMFAVRVNDDGDLIGCTTRWNLSDSRDQNAMNVEEISNVIKMPFYDVFKPNTTWRDALANAMRGIANGEDPSNVFDDYNECENGFLWVELYEKYNFINQMGQLITELPTTDKQIKGKWFDKCEIDFNEKGFAKIELNDKESFINEDGKLLLNMLFDRCIYLSNGYRELYIKDKTNLIDKNWELFYDAPIDKWFDYFGRFDHFGWARICLNDKWNFVNKNKQLLTDIPTADELIKGKWFDECDELRNGWMSIGLGDKHNFVNQNGELLYKKPIERWFRHYAYFGDDGIIRIEFNGKYNLINQNGDLLYDVSEDQWFDDCYRFTGGLSKIIRNGKCNFVKKEGGLLFPNQWFDNVSHYNSDIVNPIVAVELGNEWYFGDKNGNLFKGQSRVSESLIRNVVRESIMSYIKMDIMK